MHQGLAAQAEDEADEDPSVQPIIWGRLQAWACKVAELCPHELLVEHGLLDIGQEVSACDEICVTGCGRGGQFAEVTRMCSLSGWVTHDLLLLLS